MIRILVLLLAVVTGVASYYLMKKSAAFYHSLKETATESQQFIERFGRYYLIIAILGVLAAILIARYCQLVLSFCFITFNVV